jgi:hypothetical protein
MGDTVYVGSHDYAVYAIAAGFPPGYIRLSPKVANVPDEFVAMPPTELRDLLNTILDLPSLGAESHTYSEQGVTTVDLDFTEQAVAIFETGYYSLTDVSPESEGWTPRILSLEDYIDLVDKEHGGNPEIKQWLAYCCERTTDGLELIIKGGLPSPSVIAGVAHEAGHARQRIRNPVQSKYDGPNHAAIHEAEAFALAAGLIRELGGYAGVNATLFPIESNSSSYIRNWTSSTQALLEDMTEEHLRGRALLWEAVLHDPLLEDLRGELIEQKILSSESLLRLHNYLVDLPPAGIDAYVENMLSKFTADRKLIEETLLRRIASLPSEGFAEHERGLFLLP